MKLDKKIQGIIRPWYPDLDISRVEIVQGGVIAWFFAKIFNAAAVTINGVIYLTKKSYWKPEDPYNIFGLSLLVHELKHIEQQKSMGNFRFYVKYLLDWIRAGFRDGSELPLEAPAYKISEEFIKRTIDTAPMVE